MRTKTQNCLDLPKSTHVDYDRVEVRTVVQCGKATATLLFVPLPSHSISELPSQPLDDITGKFYTLLVSFT